jgi:hypothetical protein
MFFGKNIKKFSLCRRHYAARWNVQCSEGETQLYEKCEIWCGVPENLEAITG